MDREHILTEIRRTTQRNGGKPLGARRFELETGIRSVDWFGRYWARWGDALREAGFAPNELQTAFDEEHLLEAYAGLTLELDALPVKGDLKLKRSRDPQFPSFKTFERFGSKDTLVARLAEFCEGRPEYARVLELCRGYRPRSSSPVELTPAAAAPVLGFVYLLRSGKYYKIGRTNAAGRRERELAIQLPEPAASVHTIKTDDPVGIEEYWHKRFAEKRRHGEWFELDAQDVAAFRRRRFM